MSTGTQSGGAVVGSNGISTFTVNVPSVASTSGTISYINANYIQDGYNAAPGGGALIVNSAAGTATETITDRNGVVWTVAGTMSSDGHTVNLSASSSDSRTFTTTLDASLFAGSVLGTNAAQLARTGAFSTIRPFATTAAKVAAVAGAVSAGAAMVAWVAGFVPGGQGVAAVAAGVAVVSGCVAAGAVIVDTFFSKESNKN